MTDQKALQLLEYPKILAMLADEAETAGGRARCLALAPTDDAETAEEWLSQTEAALALSVKKGSFGFGAIPDMEETLRRVGAGGLLSGGELLAVMRVLESARRLKAYRGEEAENASVLDDYFVRLRPDKALEERIRRTFVSEEEIADTASAELSDIRRKIKSAQNRVRESLNKLIHGPKYQKVLQDAVITQRGGRFVVPVKAEYRGEVSGLVHDVSTTGMTLFIEPTAVVDANNEIRLLESRERHEIERIFAELSAAVWEDYATVEEDYAWLIFFDFCFARAKFAEKLRAYRPKLTTDGRVELIRARHPLLDPALAVPLDLSLSGKIDTLIITGPNTGGKTVALKTAGLLCCMAASGLFLPASEGSAVSVFDKVLVDVGDEQSIEQSLSTFSAHMTNIISIISQAGARSLCLFDELGAGTDPVEGAALSEAILEHIRKKGARILCTTHYPELKVYALQTAGVQNASCEFDVATLRPTYRLITGMPGRSNAFAISERLGLPGEIIESASTHLTADDIAFEQILSKIEENRQQTERMRAEAESALQSAKEAQARAASRARELEEKLNHDYEQARGEGKRVVASAKARIERVLEELDALIKEKERADFKQRVGAFKDKTRAALREIDDEIDPVREQKTEYELPRPLKVGDTVEVVGIARAAKVTALPDGKGRVRLSAGAMNFDADVKDVRLIKPPKEKKAYQAPVARAAGGVKSELNVIGLTVAEMEPEVSQFIDKAALAGMPSVRIVHGKGTGVLRAAVADLLSGHPSVESYRAGKYGEGDAGVTVVTLK